MDKKLKLWALKISYQKRVHFWKAHNKGNLLRGEPSDCLTMHYVYACTTKGPNWALSNTT